MNEFILTKDKRSYTLTCNGFEITRKDFSFDYDAIEYFRNYITSFPQSFLSIKL